MIDRIIVCEVLEFFKTITTVNILYIYSDLECQWWAASSVQSPTPYPCLWVVGMNYSSGGSLHVIPYHQCVNGFMLTWSGKVLCVVRKCEKRDKSTNLFYLFLFFIKSPLKTLFFGFHLDFGTVKSTRFYLSRQKSQICLKIISSIHNTYIDPQFGKKQLSKDTTYLNGKQLIMCKSLW